ncbi:MAG: VanZ family protein [Lachnospiraceae bacterium]|nr:VanZ family protein [Lachnospiraceae bacterium]
MLSFLPTVLVLVLIFYFSLQPGEESLQTSESMGLGMYQLVGGTGTLSQAQLDVVNLLVRAAAHFAEYAVLAVCLAWAGTRNGIRRQLRAVYMCGLSFIIAVLDEFVQIFVPGRYGDPLDLAVDMVAVLIVSVLVYKLRGPRRLERPKELEGCRRDFLNLQLDDVSFAEAVDRIMAFAAEDQERCRILVTPNADHVMLQETDKEFVKVYREADLITTDGTPLMWIGDSFNCPIREKVTGSDLLPAVCKRAAEEGRSIFFFAASKELIAKAKEKLPKEYPGLNIVGGYSPPMHFEDKPSEVEKALVRINKAKPDILVVGVGSPKSEKFLYRLRERLQCRVALPIGAAIAFAVGEQQRAPEWMRKKGLEWFYRFLQEPGRMFRRYFVQDMKIFLLALRYRDRTIMGYTGKGKHEDRDRSDKSE